MFVWVSVAAGGAIGAVLRHAVNLLSIATLGPSFPAATMIVNIVGSLILGLLTGLFAHYYSPSPELRAFLVTGFLGAFTTFSTFSLDTVTLFERGAYGLLSFYLLGSVFAAVFAFFIGLVFVRNLVS